MALPREIRVRSYQVGFGDCYLLTFHYRTVDRHVLIDFGSTGKPKKAAQLTGTLRKHMQRVAHHIVETCNGKLHAVVATHRHKDHISGFDTEGGPGSSIRQLRPNVVLQPWTEHPDADPDGVAPPTFDDEELSFVAGLKRMDLVAQSARNLARNLMNSPALRRQRGLVAELGFLGETNLRNASAVANLMTMTTNPRYLSYGQASGLNLSGVKVHVLGPPTLEQFKTIGSQRSDDPDEFWMLRAANAHLQPVAKRHPLFKGFERPSHDASTVWLRQRLQRAGLEERLALVRQLDSALNNTSLILLFEAGDQKLLFPGDAQIENWEWALDKAPDAAKNLELLRDVTVYKAGHHGSRNATPKTLWNNFDLTDGDPQAPRRLKTFVSTAEGKHGHAGANTEVPRASLMKAFAENSDLRTTEKVDPNGAEPFIETVLPVNG